VDILSYKHITPDTLNADKAYLSDMEQYEMMDMTENQVSNGGGYQAGN
jgi:hypothetical protein